VTPDAHDRPSVLLRKYLSLPVELAAAQRCATSQRVRLSLSEPMTSVIKSNALGAGGGIGVGGDLGYVGGYRSLTRHAGPFPF
jgi:hypothetical protein